MADNSRLSVAFSYDFYRTKNVLIAVDAENMIDYITICGKK